MINRSQTEKREKYADQDTGDLPAKEILENENIFVMDESRAIHQDIRPLQVCILNLMPLKEDTELQLLRALSNTPLQVDITFLTVKPRIAECICESCEQMLYSLLIHQRSKI